MARVLPLRPHSFRLDNCIIDEYAEDIGAIGVAVYATLARYADRASGECWPKVKTIADKLHLSPNCVKKYLHQLASLGLISIAFRYTDKGDHTSNRYTLHDPTNRDAVTLRRACGGGPPAARPPAETRHPVPDGGPPAAHEQESAEQGKTTAAAPEKRLCTNTQHERVRFGAYVVCIECFTAAAPDVPPRGTSGEVYSGVTISPDTSHDIMPAHRVYSSSRGT
jgi:helix-turn-helix protein